DAAPAAILLAGAALGASVAFNPIVGAVFCAVYGVTVLAALWPVASGGSERASHAGPGVDSSAAMVVMKHALAVVPVMAALAWTVLNQVGEGAGSVLHFGFWGPARNATVITFLLSFGALLVPMGIALWPDRGQNRHRLVPGVTGVAASILLMHLVTLTV